MAFVNKLDAGGAEISRMFDDLGTRSNGT